MINPKTTSAPSRAGSSHPSQPDQHGVGKALGLLEVEMSEDEQVLLYGEGRVEVVQLRRDAALRRAIFDSPGSRNPSTSSSPSSAID